MAIEPDDEASPAPPPGPPVGKQVSDATGARARRARVSPFAAQAELSGEARAAERRAARRVFRLYCFSCGRSTESAVAPQRPGRCPTCGGSMLLELASD